MEIRFSLESMHGLDMEIEDWLKTNQLRAHDLVSKTTLNRWNKESLICSLINVLKLLERSQNLLNDAAVDLDYLKGDHIQNQSKLLVVQEELIYKRSEHLEAVKSTVDDKLTSLGEVVKGKSEQQQSSHFSEIKLKQAVKSAIEDTDSVGNTILYNVTGKEGKTDSSGLHSDKETDKEVIKSNGVEISHEVTCERLARTEKNNSIPLKVKVGNLASSEISTKSRVFKGPIKFDIDKVFVIPDRCKEKIERSKLAKELKQKRVNNPDKHCYIIK